jgi:hypothetical protein
MTETKNLSRDDLFERVKRGVMTPDEAEAKARELELRPLNPPLDPAVYDVMAEPDWTIAMAVAWICTRDCEVVRRFWPWWCVSNRIWKRTRWSARGVAGEAPVIDGYCLDHEIEMAPLNYVLTWYDEDDDQVMASPAAKDALWTALANGELVGEGRRGKSLKQLPASYWPKIVVLIRTKYLNESDLGILSTERFARQSMNRNGDIANVLFADEIFVRRSDVVRIWPVSRAAAATAPPMITRTEQLHAAVRQVAEEMHRAGLWFVRPVEKRYDDAEARLRRLGFEEGSASLIKQILKGTEYMTRGKAAR